MKTSSHIRGNARESFLEPEMSDSGLICEFRLICFQFHKIFIFIEQRTIKYTDYSNAGRNISSEV